MIALVGSWRQPADTVDAALPFFRYMIEKTKAEPGCLQCNYALDVLQPGLVRVVLYFADLDALIAHRKTPYVTEKWAEFAAEFGVYDFDVDQFDVDNAIQADWTDTNPAASTTN